MSNWSVGCPARGPALHGGPLPIAGLFTVSSAPAHNGHDRKVTWLELFFDLVFVAAVASLSSRLWHRVTPAGVLDFAVVFFPVWWAWVGHTMYMTRFDRDDAAHRGLTLVQMLFVAGMAATVDEGRAGDAPFVLLYVATRAVLVAEYLLAARRHPEAAGLCRHYAAGFAAAALVWAASAAVPYPQRLLVWLAAAVIDVATPFTAVHHAVRWPPHPTHLPERVGLFTIIVLGEGVMSVTSAFDGTAPSPSDFVHAAVGLGTLFAMWWVYFDAVGGADGRGMGSRREVKAFQLWLYAHLPLTAAITAFAAGVHGALAHGTHTGWEAHLIAGAGAAAGWAMSALWFASPRAATARVRRPVVALHQAVNGALTALVAAAGTLGFTGTLAAVGVLFHIHALLNAHRAGDHDPA